MISTAKDASRLGTLIRPNGTRLPITGLQSEGKISVTGVYVEFETTIGACHRFRILSGRCYASAFRSLG